MKKSGIPKFLPPYIVYLILTLDSGILTIYNNPDVSMQTNPLVTKFHLGWGAIITANVIVLAVLFFLCRYTFDKYETIVADVPNLRAYISQMFYNRPDKFSWFWYKFPKNKKPMIAMSGYAFIYALIGGAAVHSAEWTAITFGINMTAYNNFCDRYSFGRPDLLVVVVLAFVLMFVWMIKEYKRSCKALGTVQK